MFFTEEHFILKKKLKVKKEVQMLEIWKMQHYIYSFQTKHPNYLNSAPVQMSCNKRKEIRQRCYLLLHSIGCTVTATD